MLTSDLPPSPSEVEFCGILRCFHGVSVTQRTARVELRSGRVQVMTTPRLQGIGDAWSAAGAQVFPLDVSTFRGMRRSFRGFIEQNGSRCAEQWTIGSHSLVWDSPLLFSGCCNYGSHRHGMSGKSVCLCPLKNTKRDVTARRTARRHRSRAVCYSSTGHLYMWILAGCTCDALSCVKAA